MSAQEKSKRYSWSIIFGSPLITMPIQLLEVQSKLQSGRKSSLILKSKSTTNIPISFGDSVEAFIISNNNKRNEWLSTSPMLSYDHENRTITVAEKNEWKITAALEVIRATIHDNPLSNAIENIWTFLIKKLVMSSLIYTNHVQREEMTQLYPTVQCLIFLVCQSTQMVTTVKIWQQAIELKCFCQMTTLFCARTIASYNENTYKNYVKNDDWNTEVFKLIHELWRHENSETTNAIKVELAPRKELELTEIR